MNRHWKILVLSGAFICAIGSLNAVGQDRGDRGSSDRDRGSSDRDRGSSDRDRGSSRSSDPSDFFKRMDENNNGVLEPNEVSSRSRGYLEKYAAKAGLDINQAMPVDKLAAAYKQLREESSSGGSSSSSSSPKYTAPVAAAGPSAFGAKPALAPAAGFDVPLSVDASVPANQRYDPKVVEYVEERMMKEQDKNKDGYIDSNEWKAGRWSTSPESSDTNHDNRLSREELYVRLSGKFNLPPPSSKSSSSSSSSYGQRSSSSGSSSSGSGSSSSGSSGDSDRFRRYAEGLIRQYDKNKSGMLEKSKDEWDDLKSDHRAADANSDGVITLDEMTKKLAAYSSGSSSSSSSGSSSSSSRQSWWKNGSETEGAKTTYRFLTAAERLPKGLPDWYLRNDANGDGQITMTEYTTAWTEAAAADFMRIDLNGDGIVTPDEGLAANQKR